MVTVCVSPGMLPVTVMVYCPVVLLVPPAEELAPALEATPQPARNKPPRQAEAVSAPHLRRRTPKRPIGTRIARAKPICLQFARVTCACWLTEKLTVANWLALPVNVTDAGTVHVAVAGKTEHVRLTGPVDPFTESISS